MSGSPRPCAPCCATATPTRTICPSDVARAVGGSSWRSRMDAARAVAAELHDAGVVRVRQRGEDVDPRTARGPVRIARGPRFS